MGIVTQHNANEFAGFLKAYPSESAVLNKMDGIALAKKVEDVYGVKVPEMLQRFWSAVGWGYFGQRSLYFFGEGLKPMPRHSLLEWNRRPFWDDVYRSYPPEARMFVFAETLLGNQIGFCHVGERCWVQMFCVGVFKLLLITEDFAELFSQIFPTGNVFRDGHFHRGMLEHHGQLPIGKHYVPIVPPLLGGSERPSNHKFEDADLHMRTAVIEHATASALRKKS